YLVTKAGAFLTEGPGEVFLQQSGKPVNPDRGTFQIVCNGVGKYLELFSAHSKLFGNSASLGDFLSQVAVRLRQISGPSLHTRLEFVVRSLQRFFGLFALGYVEQHADQPCDIA